MKRLSNSYRAESFCRGQSLGSVTKTVTVRIPAGALEPGLEEGWVRLTPYNEGAAAGFQSLIAGFSRLEAGFDAAKIDPAPLLGATVTGYALDWEGETVGSAPYRTAVIRSPGTVTVSVLDSRGLRSSRSFPVEPLSYAPPALSRVSVYRCDDLGTENENGTALAVRAELSYSALGGENTCSLTAAVRPPMRTVM